MPFHKILVPVDDSPHAVEAIRIAAQLSARCHAPLTVFHAYEAIWSAVPGGIVMLSASALADVVADADRLVRRAAEQATAAGAVGVTWALTQGPPFLEILRYARDQHHDLIVMGTHGRAGLGRALLGSVAERVVRKAPCAVLTTHAAGEPRAT